MRVIWWWNPPKDVFFHQNKGHQGVPGRNIYIYITLPKTKSKSPLKMWVGPKKEN